MNVYDYKKIIEGIENKRCRYITKLILHALLNTHEFGII